MSTTTLTNQKQVKKVENVDIVREGRRIIIPEGMKLEEAIAAIQRRAAQEEQEVEVIEDVDAFIPDACVALARAMAEMFGWVNLAPTPGFFGPEPPQMIGVKINAQGETVQAPWGAMTVAAMPGTKIRTTTTFKNGRFILRIAAKTKRKYEPQIQELGHLTRKYVREQSIYRGKAFRIRLADDDGSPLPFPEPEFLNLDGPEPRLILPQAIADSVQDNIWTPIEYARACQENGVPTKRGIVLAGPYGTGKTLTAHITARRAVGAGWTFILLDRVSELRQGVELALQYQPAVLFSEDLDRVVTGERTLSMDDILNTVDGIQKSGKIMLVLSTNHPEAIHKAMLRPGRIDAVIPFSPPDAEAAERLVRHYTNGLLEKGEDLTPVGEKLAGRIPAVIREVCERAKLRAISRIAEDFPEIGMYDGVKPSLTAQDLLRAADTMTLQLQLLEGEAEDTRTPLQRFGYEIEELVNRAERTFRGVQKIKDHMGISD